MYNIEEKIKSWFNNNVWSPVVSNLKIIQEEKKKKQEDAQEKPTLTILTDEELNKKAHDSLVDNYNRKKTDLQNNFDLDVERLNGKTQEKIKGVNSERQGVEDYYNELNKNAVDNSVKQGISRSSILGGQVDKNNQEKQKQFYDIESKIADILSSGQNEVDYYTKKYQNDLDSLDSQFAIAVKEKFEKLKAEQDKKIKEYNKEQEETNKPEVESKPEVDNKPETDKPEVDSKPETDEPEEEKFNEKEYAKLVEKYKNITLNEINLEEFDKLREEDKTAVRQAIFDEILAYYYSMPPEKAKESYKTDERIKRILGDYTKVLERYLNSYN